MIGSARRCEVHGPRARPQEETGSAGLTTCEVGANVSASRLRFLTGYARRRLGLLSGGALASLAANLASDAFHAALAGWLCRMTSCMGVLICGALALRLTWRYDAADRCLGDAPEPDMLGPLADAYWWYTGPRARKALALLLRQAGRAALSAWTIGSVQVCIAGSSGPACLSSAIVTRSLSRPCWALSQ